MERPAAFDEVRHFDAVQRLLRESFPTVKRGVLQSMRLAATGATIFRSASGRLLVQPDAESGVAGGANEAGAPASLRADERAARGTRIEGTVSDADVRAFASGKPVDSGRHDAWGHTYRLGGKARSERSDGLPTSHRSY